MRPMRHPQLNGAAAQLREHGNVGGGAGEGDAADAATGCREQDGRHPRRCRWVACPGIQWIRGYPPSTGRAEGQYQFLR